MQSQYTNSNKIQLHNTSGECTVLSNIICDSFTVQKYTTHNTRKQCNYEQLSN